MSIIGKWSVGYRELNALSSQVSININILE